VEAGLAAAVAAGPAAAVVVISVAVAAAAAAPADHGKTLKSPGNNRGFYYTYGPNFYFFSLASLLLI
jgi:hypothetical protein